MVQFSIVLSPATFSVRPLKGISIDAILDAVKKDDYNEKHLNRDLNIFKQHYGDDNLKILELIQQVYPQ